jgi:hypothetical protein
MHLVQEEMLHASRVRVNRTSRMVQLAPEGEITMIQDSASPGNGTLLWPQSSCYFFLEVTFSVCGFNASAWRHLGVAICNHRGFFLLPKLAHQKQPIGALSKYTSGWPVQWRNQQNASE